MGRYGRRPGLLALVLRRRARRNHTLRAEPESPTPSIFRAPLGGGTPQTVGTFSTIYASYAGMAVSPDEREVFAATFSEVLRVDVCSGAVTQVFTGEVGEVRALGHDVYFTTFEEPSGAAVRRQRPGDLAATIVARFDERVGGLEVILAGDTLWRAPLDGGAPTAIARGLCEAAGVVLGLTDAYVTVSAVTSDDEHGRAIVRIPVDGLGEPELLVDDMRIGAMRIHDGTLYFVSLAVGRLGVVGRINDCIR